MQHLGSSEFGNPGHRWSLKRLCKHWISWSHASTQLRQGGAKPKTGFDKPEAQEMGSWDLLYAHGIRKTGGLCGLLAAVQLNFSAHDQTSYQTLHYLHCGSPASSCTSQPQLLSQTGFWTNHFARNIHAVCPGQDLYLTSEDQFCFIFPEFNS